MKKVLLLIITVFSLLFSQAQMSESENLLARNLVSKNKEAIGFSAESLNNYIVSSTFDNPRSNCRMVYLQQTYKGIPVFNQMLVLAFRNGNLLSKAGVYDPSFEKLVNNTSGIPARTAESAVQSAIMDRKLPISDEAQTVINRSSKGDFVEFNDMGISRENITAQLIWAPIENSPKFHLAWQVYIIPNTTPDYWLIRVDAIDGKIIGLTNLTDYDDWGHPEEGTSKADVESSIKKETNTTYNNLFYFNDKATQEDLITTATYRVIPIPYESPNHMPSPPSSATVTDPWLAAPGNATTLKWNTGLAGVDYDYTRGNNVWAYQDRTPQNNTGTVAKSASSTTALPNLTFNFVPDYTQEPTVATVAVPNQQFNITNLFYWNNVIHDVFYQYGFTEAGGNFQDDNMGRGGVGNDHVNAEAQDGGGTNNANFATPADGSSGRMQMYLWTAPTPDRDGDVDNGIIVHEFGHGIGKRITGGPANTACLTTSEQGGEGISDYFGLMLTQDWTTATLTTGFNSPRGVGTYALNQPLTGNGIRPTRYTTNFAINPRTYADIATQAVPHGVGYVWCTMLWEMTWELINTIGVISPNIYDASATGGNIVAMNLVMEGLRLQPCQPGFVDAKNAILQADMNLYAGANQCAIIRAFARRGLGVNALQGTNARGDETPDFTGGGPTMNFTQSGAAGVPVGQNIVYNHAVTANCQAITNHTLRDTLPLNVTFVSATNGGTYNAGNRVVSWPVNLGVNATGNYGLTVNINPGSYFPPIVLLNETVPTTTIPATWTAASTTANVWVAHNVRSNSPPNSFFTIDAAVTSDQTLATTNSFAIGATAPELSFWHNYVTEASWDGAVLEISTNGGTTWSDIGAANFTQNGYNGTLNTGSPNPLTGRAAWNGNSGGFVQTKVNMQPYANQATVKLRWRFGSDGSLGAQGWNVDDIQLQTIAVVNLRTSLFDAGNTRVDFKDTVTVILPPANPGVTINQAVGQPDPTTASPINFTVVFDQPVIGFTTGDVTLTGTGLPTTGTVTEIAPNDGTTYNVAVSGMSATGTVIANVGGGVCTNAGLDPNNSSTSTDNVVNFSLEPLNDLCANAELITCGQTLSGSTVTATNDFPPAPNCQGASTAPGVWYRFIGNGGSTTVSLCGSGYDTKLFLYSGTCAGLVCEGFNDDFCGLSSEVTIPTTSGVTYYALVHGFFGATGAYNITLTCTCPTLSVDPVANQTVCNGAATTAVTFTGLEPATIYTWTNNTPSIGLAASGTGNIASFTATNTGTAPVTATITVTPTYTGCPDGPSRTFTYTVNPTPNAVATPASQTICSGSAITPIVLTGAVTGTTYTWTRNNTATVTGIATSGSGSPINGTLTNTTAAPVTVTFTITPMANGCPGPTTTATVLVNPTPNAIATPSSQTVCSGSAITTIVLSSATTGTTYAWVRNNTATVTGIAASGSNNISGTLTNTTNTPVTVTFTISSTANGCPGSPITATVTVQPTPTVDNIPNQTVCNGTMTAPVNFTGTIPGTIYNWMNNTPSIGLAASGTGNIAAFTATNATLVPVTATVTVTPNTGTPETTIPLPPQASTFTGNVRGYWFTAPTTFTMTSLFVPTSASTGPQNIAVVRFNGATPPPIFPATTNAFSTLFLTQVNASATAIPVNITINAGDVIGILGNRVNINSYASTTVFSTTIAGFAVPLTRMGMQFPLATSAPQSIFGVNSGQISRVEFSYTTGCAGPSKTFDITVNPTPTITCPGNITRASNVGACNVAVPYTVTATGTPTPTFSYVLTGATTGSGAGTGTGLLFNVGVTTVTVTATNICGAPTCTFTITVTDSQLPVINTQPANRTVCMGSSATFSVAAVTAPSAGGPLSYQWQIWNPTTATWSNISGATASSYTVSNTTLSMNTNSYRVNVIGLCTTVPSNHASLYVNPLPIVNLTTSIPPDLLPTQVLTITATVSPTGGTYVWRKDGNVIAGATGNTLSGLTVSDAGIYSLVYTDLNGCVSTSSNIVVRAQASGNLYVYPVPNRGVFNVRFYNQTGEAVTVRVFDAKGSEVYQRKSATTLPYTTINVDMTTRGILAAGVYIVEVRGADARLIGTKKIIVHNN